VPRAQSAAIDTAVPGDPAGWRRASVAAEHDLVRQHPRPGYRMIRGMLRLEGWRMKRKRVHRLWRQEGLKVSGIQHKRTLLGHSENGILRRPAEHINHVWAIDFIYDTDARDRSLKWLSGVNEFTRECVALEVGRSMTASGVAEVTDRPVHHAGRAQAHPQPQRARFHRQDD
jgi:hypothetical protein